MSWADTRVCPYDLHASVNLCYFAHKLFFFGPIDSTRLSRPAWHKLRLCYTRLFAARAIYRSICDCCVCPIDSTRLSRPAWHKLRLCYTQLFAARAIYRSICVTSPTNCPIHHDGCCRAGHPRSECLQLSCASVENHPS